MSPLDDKIALSLHDKELLQYGFNPLQEVFHNSSNLSITEVITTICFSYICVVDNPSFLDSWRGWNYKNELDEILYNKNIFTVDDFEKVCRNFAWIYHEIYNAAKKLNLSVKNEVIPCSCCFSSNWDVNFNLDVNKFKQIEWYNYIQELFNLKFKNFTAIKPNCFTVSVVFQLNEQPLTIYIGYANNKYTGIIHTSNNTMYINESE